MRNTHLRQNTYLSQRTVFWNHHKNMVIISRYEVEYKKNKDIFNQQ